MSAAKLELTQFCEYDARISNCEKELSESLPEMTRQSQAPVVTGKATLNIASKSSYPNDNSLADMSLISEEVPPKTQTQLVQDLNCATHQVAIQAHEVVNQVCQEFDSAIQQNSQQFQQALEGFHHSTSVTSVNVTASEQQLVLLHNSVGSLKTEHVKHKFDIQYSQKGCENEMKLLQYKVSGVLQW